MGLKGKLSAQVEYKSSGDVFHKVFCYTPHEIPKLSPGIVKGYNLHEGELGSVGSIIGWKYAHDGKEKVAKVKVEAVDEQKKLLTLKLLEGDLSDLYKDFIVSFHVETTGGIDTVIWNLEYEKHNEDVEDPLTLLGLAIKLTTDLETHHLKVL